MVIQLFKPVWFRLVRVRVYKCKFSKSPGKTSWPQYLSELFEMLHINYVNNN
jgi:hypothetical protein